MSITGSASAISGWTGCSPAPPWPLPRLRRVVHRPADGQRDPVHGDAAAARPFDPRSIRSPPGSSSGSIAGGSAGRCDEAAALGRRPGPDRGQPGGDLLAPRLRARRRCRPASARCSPARMGYISIAENQRYSDLAEANRISSRLIPPRRGWIVDRYGQPMAVNRSDFRIDLIPDQLEDARACASRTLTRILGLDAETVTRIRRELAARRGLPARPGRRASALRQVRRGHRAAARTARRVAARAPSPAPIRRAPRSAI